MKTESWKAKWLKLENEPIGRGGQGFTYKVRKKDGEDATPYILKVLMRQNDSERRARMRHEVANLKQLNHSQLAKFVDSNTDQTADEEELYLVMEYVPGLPLCDYYEQHQPDVLTAAKMVEGLLQTLGYCHEKKTVHRDIKPDNIIVRNSNPNDLVLLDFGLSFNHDAEISQFNTAPSQHIGNRFILLPEYAVRGSDKRSTVSDITQCVGILFYLVTGLTPDHLLDDKQLSPHRRTGPIAKIQSLPPDFAKQLHRIFDLGFSQEILRRFQTIPTLLNEVQKLHSPPVTAAPTFQVLLDEAKAMAINTPSNVIQDRLSLLVQIAGKQFDQIWQAFFQALRPIIIVSHVRFPMPSFPNMKWHRGQCVSSKYKGTRQFGAGFFLLFQDNEIHLTARLVSSNAPNVAPVPLGSDELLARFGIFDDQAESILRKAFETFLGASLAPLVCRPD